MLSAPWFSFPPPSLLSDAVGAQHLIPPALPPAAKAPQTRLCLESDVQVLEKEDVFFYTIASCEPLSLVSRTLISFMLKLSSPGLRFFSCCVISCLLSVLPYHPSFFIQQTFIEHLPRAGTILGSGHAVGSRVAVGEAGGVMGGLRAPPAVKEVKAL